MSSSRAMTKASMTPTRINHLAAARERLHDRFISKFLEKPSPAASSLFATSSSQNAAASLSKVDIASALLADEMKPNYLEEARYRLRTNYQAFIDTFDRDRHDALFLGANQLALESMLQKNAKESASRTNHLEEARLRLRDQFQAKFMKEHVDDKISGDVFHNFPTTTDQIPETMASSWAQDAAIVITEARSPFNILHVNQAWVGLCGYTKDEAVGQTFTTLGINAKGVTERELTKDMMNELALGEKTSVHLTNLKRNGEKFINHLRIAPVRDVGSGEVVKYFGMLEDITPQSKVGMVA